MKPSRLTSLGEARDWLRDHVKDGADCPCCGQRAQVYRRKVSGSMVKTMTRMYKQAQLDWVHLPEIPQRSRDVSTCQYFGLIEPSPERREDGGKGVAWRVTENGLAFLRGKVSVPKYAEVYDNRRLGFDGPRVSVHDVMGTRFRFDELMAGHDLGAATLPSPEKAGGAGVVTDAPGQLFSSPDAYDELRRKDAA